ncbi:MAG: polysaccharide biosynthesis C-terminal domain-containing protein [Ichthyobacteriaceae bacterium]|nr:polysaccharide biosynthesis C-terminal domain-containing protein [Ichthyobacteriaceae bacterium]
MGVVVNQSIKNVIFTYLGFGVGAINTLFLYPYIMDDNYYGLVAVLLSASMILFPLLSLGMSNTIIRFYSHYKTKEEKDGFLTFTFLLPLIVIIPIAILFFIFQTEINTLLSSKSKLVTSYTGYVLLYALFVGYFEVFYAYAKVQLKSVFGNVLKEVSIRIFVSVLLILLYFNIIDSDGFIKWLAVGYGVRMVVMAVYALKNYNLNVKPIYKYKEPLYFSLFVIFSASISFMVLEVDKLMISQFVNLSNVAYYSVGSFIGIVVSVPGRSMQQILMPFVSKALAENNTKEVLKLYKASSINLLVISGFVFMLIAVNVKFMYMLLPNEFAGGEYVAIIIAFSKWFDMATGINGTIITNSKFYRFDLVFGVILIVLTIVLNIIFIPLFGIFGAGLATAFGMVLYNLMKLFFVKNKFGYFPFSIKSFYVVAFILLLTALFYSLPLILNPIVTIIIYSLVLSVLFLAMICLIKPSEQIREVLLNVLMKFKIIK